MNKNIFLKTARLISFSLIISFIYSNSINEPSKFSGQKYVTDQDGNLLMNVNILGHVKVPGSYMVYEGIDLINLLSVVGGPLSGAKLKSIKLIRESSDKLGKRQYIIDLKEFYLNGDRSNFVNIMPNDTIIIEERLTNKVLSSTNIIPIVLQLLNIAIQLQKS